MDTAMGMANDTLVLDAFSDKAGEDRALVNTNEPDILKNDIGNLSVIGHNISLNTTKLEFGDILSNLVTNTKEAEKIPEPPVRLKTIPKESRHSERYEIEDQMKSIPKEASRVSIDNVSRRDSKSTQDCTRRSVGEVMRDNNPIPSVRGSLDGYRKEGVCQVFEKGTLDMRKVTGTTDNFRIHEKK